MKRVLIILFTLLGIGVGIYVGGWVLLIKPIVACCSAFDNGVLTATQVCWTVIKGISAIPAGIIVFFIIAAPLPCIWGGQLVGKRGIHNEKRSHITRTGGRA